MGKLDQKAAIITGGGTGIGRAIALEFAREGAAVAICGRTKPTLEKVREEIEALGRHCLAIQTDIIEKPQIAKMVRDVVKEFGTIDILVNNAATIRRASILDITEEDWDYVINVNLKGTLLCIQAVVKYMLDKKYGKIINISSINGRGGGLGAGIPYCASKAAIISLTQCAAWELGHCSINVNCIAPGLIQAPMAEINRNKEELDQFLEQRKRSSVLNRLGVPEDIARTAVFLASEDSAFISGQTIPVDGGRTDRM